MIHLTGEFLKQWPQALIHAITATPLVRQGGMETAWRCHRCPSSCLVDVEWRATPHGPTEPYLQCVHSMEWGTIPLQRSDLQLWQTSFTHLAETAATFLDLQAPREEVIPDRLWWLGGKVVAQRDIDLFLARGAAWEDASRVFARNGRLGESATPVVLVPHDVPEPSPFPGTVPVRSLASLLRFDGHHLHFRDEQLTETVRHLGSKRRQVVIPVPTASGVTWSQVIIEFANDEVVQIHVGKDRHSRTFVEMGFDDLRKPVSTPSELWGHFQTLAKYGGRIGWDTPNAVTEKNRNKVRKWISEIRQRLQVAFPTIAGDPFKSYKQEKAYQLKCHLCWSER